MLLSIFFIFKTILYLNLTQIEFNHIPIFLITSTITILILSLINLSKSKYKDIFKIIFYSLISLIMFVDVIYYSQFAALPSVIMLSQAKQLAAVTENIKYLLQMKNLFLILDIPILIIILRYMKKKDINIEIPKLSQQDKSYIVLGILVLTVGYMGITGQVQSVIAQEIYSFHAMDIIESLSGNSTGGTKTILTEEDILELENRTKLPEGKLTGIGKDKNLIVIQIESLQNFALNLEYNKQIVTPNLNKLINNSSSIYYDEYYQLIGRGNTSDTEFVSHNSLYPSMEEPSYVQYENNTFYGLPWLLRDNGYTAWSMHGYEKEFWNREKAHKTQGFERFISEEDYKFDKDEIIGFGLRDEDFFQQSLEYIKELDKIDDNPFYAFLVTLTSHAPYKMDEKYQHLELKEEDEGTLLGDYLQSIHYTDKHLGEFLENLKEEGLYDNSVIAMYGDHFAIANTNEDIKNRMAEFLDNEYDFDSMTNIPLIITIPGEDIKETNSRVGSPLDFYPTMMNIMGYENTKGLIFGRDLNNFQGHNFVAPQTFMLKGSFIDQDTLFVMSRDGIFEHSRATSMKTRKDLDVEQFKDQYERSISEINKSEFILKNDLLKDYIENEGKIDLQVFKDEEIENRELIKVGNYKTREELQKDYEDGYRLLAVNIGWDNEEIVVTENGSNMNLLELMDWVEDKEDAYIVLRTEEDREIFDKVKVKYKDEDIIGRFIPEVSSFDDYMPVTYRAFGNAILNLENVDYSESEITDFLNRHRAFGVTLSQEQVESGLAKEIRSLGVNSYIENISNKKELKKLKKKGVFGGFLQ